MAKRSRIPHIALLLFISFFGYTYAHVYEEFLKHLSSTLLDRYTRPFTFLEISLDMPFFSFPIAARYDATSVMINEDQDGEVLKACRKHAAAHSLILLKKRLRISPLTKLGQCEFPEIAIFCQCNMYFGDLLEEAVPLLMNTAEYVVLEIVSEPTRSLAWYEEMVGKMRYWIAQHAGDIKEEKRFKHAYKDHTFFIVKTPKQGTQRSHWRTQKLLDISNYKVTSTFSEKTLYKKFSNQTTPWHRGINLRTYKGLNGVFPLHEDILHVLKTFEHIQHNDKNPCNMIIKGDKIVLIDFEDPRRCVDQNKAFARCLNLFNN